MLFTGLLDPAVAVCEGEIATAAGPLFEEEHAALTNAVPRRRSEFVAGRTLARGAMRKLGLAPCSLPSLPDRTPAWPAAIIGSITHADGYCAAAVAERSRGLQAIGIDIEPAEPLPEELMSTVLTPVEAAAIASRPDAGLLARAIFSAKESAFKCQFTLSREMLEHEDLVVMLAPSLQGFEVRLQRPVGAFDRSLVLAGRLRITERWIAAAVVV